jgi:hypothetical protein
MTSDVSDSSYSLVKESTGLHHVLYEPIKGKAAPPFFFASAILQFISIRFI